MASAELLLPTARATDSNANPYAGATWTFYASGTTTPQAVYADAALTNSLGSTVTADGGGKFPPIYFDSTKVYRGVWKDASGSVTIQDIDPINNTILNSLTLPDGSSIIGFQQTGNNTIPTTLDEQIRPIKAVTAGWGALPDGALSTSALRAAINDAWTDARDNGFNLYFPKGTYDIGEFSFPWRQSFGVNELYDCMDVTIHGDGPETIFKTTSATGADVFQLDKVKNLHLRDLKIVGTLTGSSGSGSNGISVTGGFDNITIDRVWIENMPGVDTGTYIDGAKGLSLQLDTATLPLGRLKASNLFVTGCAQGFGLEISPDQAVDEKICVDVDLVAQDCYVAVTIGGGVATGAVPAGTQMGVRVTAQAINCQKDVQLARVHGVDVECQVITSKTAAARRLSPSGDPWYAGDTNVEALFCSYAKSSRIKVTGNKGACDYKVRIGGAAAGASGLGTATDDCDIFLNISGTAATANIAVIDFSGTVDNSRIFVAAGTGTVPDALLVAARGNVFVLGATQRFIDVGLTGPLSLLAADGKTASGEFKLHSGFPASRQMGGSLAALPIHQFLNDANIRVAAVRNDGAMQSDASVTPVALGAVAKILPLYDTGNTLLGYIEVKPVA